MLSDPPTDRQLLNRFRTNGDRAALSSLLERHRSVAYRVALGVLWEPADAEDAVQDAFLNLIRYEPRMWVGDSLAGLVARMALRSAQHLARSRGRRRSHENIWADVAAPAEVEPEEILVERETRIAVTEAVGRLDVPYRLPVVLYYYEGLSTLETARALGISHTATRSRLSRAVARLRRDLTARGVAASFPAALALLRPHPTEAAGAVAPADTTAPTAAAGASAAAACQTGLSSQTGLTGPAAQTPPPPALPPLLAPPPSLGLRLEALAVAAPPPVLAPALAGVAVSAIKAKVVAAVLVVVAALGGIGTVRRLPPPPDAGAALPPPTRSAPARPDAHPPRGMPAPPTPAPRPARPDAHPPRGMPAPPTEGVGSGGPVTHGRLALHTPSGTSGRPDTRRARDLPAPHMLAAAPGRPAICRPGHTAAPSGGHEAGTGLALSAVSRAAAGHAPPATAADPGRNGDRKRPRVLRRPAGSVQAPAVAPDPRSAGTESRGPSAEPRMAAAGTPAPTRSTGAGKPGARAAAGTKPPAAPDPRGSAAVGAPAPALAPQSAAGAAAATVADDANLPPPLARILIDDFEGSVSSRWHTLVSERATVKEGSGAGKWSGTLEDAVNTRVQRQWDTFAEPHLEFWCHSAAAGACFRIELLSDNPATPALDGYALPVTVDWKGWKRLRLPISAFAAAGRPAGTGEIGAVRLTVRAPGCLVPRDTALCFDDMWLCERKGQFARPPAPGDVDAWAQSPAFDVANWKGMQPETKITLTGAPAGRWANPGVNSAVWGGDVPADWSRYSDLEMWIYAEGVRGLPIEFSAQSDSPATPETDDYRRYLIVDWDGWRLVRLARWQFDTYKSPLGWNQVQSFSIRNLAAVWGYTPATVRPEGFLCLEGVRLSNRSGGLALDTAGLSVAAEGAGGGATFLLPYRQTNLGEKPVAFTLAVMEKADLGRLRIEPAGTPPLPGLAAQAGKVTVSITAQDLAQPRGFFREAQVVTTPAHGPQALTAVPFSLEPLYYRALDLLHLPVPETLVVEAFEEGPYRWSGLLPDTAVVHGGKQSALWENAGHRGIVYCNSLPHDWSRYDTLSFWLHSETATGQRFDFCAFSDNRNTPAQDYWYVKDYRVDWTGWKQFTLRLEEMDNIRDPVSWGQIDRIGFFTGWFANEPTDGTMLRLDDIVLTRGKGAQ